MNSINDSTEGVAPAPHSAPSLRTQGFLLALLCLPLFLNDFANIYLKDAWVWWYVVDLGIVKTFQLGLIIWMLARGLAQGRDFGLRKIRSGAFILVAVLMTLGGTIVLMNGTVFLNRIIALKPLGGYPSVPSPWFRWVDLTLDIGLVALLEETIFRGYMETVLRRMNFGTFGIVLVSSICFGLIHWSNGVQTVIMTSLAGAMFMGFYLKCRSTLPLIVAHYLIDFIFFSMLVPYTWFLYI